MKNVVSQFPLRNQRLSIVSTISGQDVLRNFCSILATSFPEHQLRDVAFALKIAVGITEDLQISLSM